MKGFPIIHNAGGTQTGELPYHALPHMPLHGLMPISGASLHIQMPKIVSQMRQLDDIIDSMDMSLSKIQEMMKGRKPGVLQSMGSQRVRYD